MNQKMPASIDAGILHSSVATACWTAGEAVRLRHGRRAPMPLPSQRSAARALLKVSLGRMTLLVSSGLGR